MHEVFPVLSGLALGVVLAAVAPRLRAPLGVVGATVLGTTATVVSGEAAIGWEFLLVDVPLVAVASLVGLLATRRLLRPSHA